MNVEHLNLKTETPLNYKTGVHDISNSQYHKTSAISRSMLMDFKKNPSYYWYKHISGRFIKDESTPAMNLGSAVHTLVLEDQKFDSEFFVIHQKSRPIRGTAPYAKMLDDAKGKIILTDSEYQQAFAMAKSVLDNPEAYSILLETKIEKSIFFEHEATNLMCKVRPDAWSNGLVIDLKTSADANIKSFQSSCVNYGYFLQAGMMQYGLNRIEQPMEQFVFIVVEKEPPYAVAIYTLSDEALDFGLNQYHFLMNNLAKCINENNWPGYGIRELKLPKYALFDEMIEIE